MSVPNKMLESLAEYPCCAAELAEDLGITLEHSRAALSYLRNRFPPDDRGRRSVYIAGWKRSSIGGKFYLRAVYAAGLGVDVPSPGALSRAEYNRRYRGRTGQALSSVFELGQRVKDRRAAFDWRSRKPPQHLTHPPHSNILSLSSTQETEQ